MNNETRYLESFKTIDEIELAVSQLGDWTKPEELYKYLEILYQLTLFYNKYEIRDVNYGGLVGTFSGRYNGNILAAARQICSTKFPGEEIWEQQPNRAYKLKDNIHPSVSYLANYTLGGMGVIMERSDFRYNFESTYNCRLKEQNLDEIMSIQTSAIEYMQGKTNKR